MRQDFLHLVLRLDEREEHAWGRRLHLPLQLGLSMTSTASRGRLA